MTQATARPVHGRATADDGRLVARAQGGDANAWTELYRLHHESVTAVCLARVRDPEVAADLVHDTFERALRAIDAFTGGAEALGPWLRVIAKHACLDWLRRQGRERALGGTLADPAPDGPDATIDAGHRAEVVREVLAALPQRDRTLLWERHVLERAVPAMAHDHGLTPGSMAVTLHRARLRFRERASAVKWGLAAPLVGLRERSRTALQRAVELSVWEPWAPAVAMAAAVLSMTVLGAPSPTIGTSDQAATATSTPSAASTSSRASQVPGRDIDPWDRGAWVETDALAPSGGSQPRVRTDVPGTDLVVQEGAFPEEEDTWRVAVHIEVGGQPVTLNVDGFGAGVISDTVHTVCEDDIDVGVASCGTHRGSTPHDGG